MFVRYSLFCTLLWENVYNFFFHFARFLKIVQHNPKFTITRIYFFIRFSKAHIYRVKKDSLFGYFLPFFLGDVFPVLQCGKFSINNYLQVPKKLTRLRSKYALTFRHPAISVFG